MAHPLYTDLDQFLPQRRQRLSYNAVKTQAWIAISVYVRNAEEYTVGETKEDKYGLARHDPCTRR